MEKARVIDEAKLNCVSDNVCGVKQIYLKSTTRSTTCYVGDLMDTNHCMSFYFECDEDNIIEVKACYKNGIFEESKSICANSCVCSRAQDVVA